MARARWIAAEHGIIPARAGVYTVPLAYLDDCPAQAWNPGRLPPIRRAYDEGRTGELPAIVVVFFEDGSLRIDDGNHRLTVARERERGQQQWIRVRYVRGGRRPAGAPFVIPPHHGGQERPTTWGPHYQAAACMRGVMKLAETLRTRRAQRAAAREEARDRRIALADATSIVRAQLGSSGRVVRLGDRLFCEGDLARNTIQRLGAEPHA